MSINELETRIEKMKEWEALADEAKSEAEAIKESIKIEMQERNASELSAGKYIVRWTDVVSNRFDSAAFKKVHGDLYKAFTRAVSSLYLPKGKTACESC